MLNTDLLNEPQEVKVEIISIQGATPHTIAKGTTVGELKRKCGLAGLRLIDENNEVLNDNYVINSEKQIYCSAPKRNGK